MKAKLLLLGSTGDLARKKIIPQRKSIEADLVCFGRKDKPEFLENIQYIQGELEEIPEKVSDLGITHIYAALPPSGYELVIKAFAKLHSVNPRVMLALEKPFGTSLEQAKQLHGLIKDLGIEENVYLVDHYLGKTALHEAVNIHNFDTSVIHMKFLEQDDVSTRGAFYDSVGVVRDVVQNHILATISAFLKPSDCDGDRGACRKAVLRKIKYEKGSVLHAQYDGYRETAGVSPESETETFVRFRLLYENITIDISAGKAMNESLVSIGDTVIRGDGHVAVINDYLRGEWQYALSFEEALISWHIAEEILEDMRASAVHIYARGTTPSDII